MDLLSVLEHAEPPRSPYFLRLPTRYGQLRVDILSPDPDAASGNGLVGDDALQAHAMVNEAVAHAQHGDLAGAEALLLDTVRRFPYSYEAFGVLSEVCTSLGRTADAVYYGRQVVGLVPSYRNLTLLARALGQAGKLPEAATVQYHLWQTRAEAQPAEALGAIHGYLVTLSKLDDAGSMVDVCAQALIEHPGDPTIRYQQAFAHLLLGRLPEARRLAEQAMATLPPGEPLAPRFAQLRDSIAARFGASVGAHLDTAPPAPDPAAEQSAPGGPAPSVFDPPESSAPGGPVPSVFDPPESSARGGPVPSVFDPPESSARGGPAPSVFDPPESSAPGGPVPSVFDPTAQPGDDPFPPADAPPPAAAADAFEPAVPAPPALPPRRQPLPAELGPASGPRVEEPFSAPRHASEPAPQAAPGPRHASQPHTPPPAFGLREVVAAIEAGQVPPADGGLTVVPGEGRAAVLAFTAHSVVAADIDPDWIRAQLPPGDLSAPLNPPFLSALTDRLGRRVNNIDLVALGPRLLGPTPLPLSEVDARQHPRVRRALRYRDDVHVWATEGGLLILGRGLGGRWELAVEVEPAYRGRGLGRVLATAGRHLVPGSTVWAQIAPGNAASVRAFVAAGFKPIGAEALLVD